MGHTERKRKGIPKKINEGKNSKYQKVSLSLSLGANGPLRGRVNRIMFGCNKIND